MSIKKPERVTQERLLKVFEKQLHYDFYGNWHYNRENSNVEETKLRPFLQQQGYADNLIKGAIEKAQKLGNQDNISLYQANKAFYNALRYGIGVKEVGKDEETVYLIDWKNPLNNHFAIAEEVTIKGKINTKRPDIVIYINGIALGLIELKSSSNSINKGIRQNLLNQGKDYIQPFFNTMQFVTAGNDPEGLKYGTIDTSEKYYLTWKEDGEERPIAVSEVLDYDVTKLFEKERLIEFLHDFIVFDRGVKKLARPNQYFGVKATQDFIRRREGGIIWHTQGSGKSLSMVWLTKWIKENQEDARVLIVTDRTELDQQIEKVFKGVNEDIYRTTSSRDLITELNKKDHDLMCSLVHKFGLGDKHDTAKAKQAYEDYIKEITGSLPKDFVPQGNLFILVDECHRTQSGALHDAMKLMAKNALIVGFTGTPLLKKDKETSIKKFGKYIHTYKFNQAVEDGVVLDLLYEARNINQNLRSQDKLDRLFERKTKNLTDFAKAELKKRWGTMQKLYSSKKRLEQIVADILFDMEDKPRLLNGRGNAMLVASSIYQACKYYELFLDNDFDKCAIVTSYVPSKQSIKDEVTKEGKTEKLLQYDIYKKMLNGKSVEQFEKDVKKIFIDEPAKMKLLIVVDKLLTGFDAPAATYLYIDKSMQDHGLFQAICRVNRLDGEDKDFGYIIDYMDLFKSLKQSIEDYTSEAFGEYEADDVDGLLKNRLKKGKERLDGALDDVKSLWEEVPLPRSEKEYDLFFCGDKSEQGLKDTVQQREMLYKRVASLVRAYANIANEMMEAGYTEKEAATIKKEVSEFQELKQQIKISSGDYIDLKLYEPGMRSLIDRYVDAEETEIISNLEDMTLIELIVKNGAEEATKSLPNKIRKSQDAMAETIEGNLRKVIIEQKPTNPKYFEKMSKLLEELIKERRQNAKDYQAFLKSIEELTKKVVNPASSNAYPSSLNSKAKRALYDNLDQNEDLAIALDKEITYTKKHGWRGHPIKERQVKKAIKKYIKDADKINEVFNIVKDQEDY